MKGKHRDLAIFVVLAVVVLVAANPISAVPGWSLKISDGAAGGAFFGIPERTPTFTILVPVEYPDGAVLHAEFFDLLTGPDPLPTSPLKRPCPLSEETGASLGNPPRDPTTSAHPRLSKRLSRQREASSKPVPCSARWPREQQMTAHRRP